MLGIYIKAKSNTVSINIGILSKFIVRENFIIETVTVICNNGDLSIDFENYSERIELDLEFVVILIIFQSLNSNILRCDSRKLIEVLHLMKLVPCNTDSCIWYSEPLFSIFFVNIGLKDSSLIEHKFKFKGFSNRMTISA